MVSSIFLLFCEFDGIVGINIISFFQPRRLGLDPWALRMQERDQAITGHKTKQQVSAIILKFSKHYMLTSSPSIIVYNYNPWFRNFYLIFLVVEFSYIHCFGCTRMK